MENSNHTSGSKLPNLSGINYLNYPGVVNNYQDQKFKMRLTLESAKLSHTLTPKTDKDRTPGWLKPNTKSCTLIALWIYVVNIEYIKPHKRDNAGMWSDLRAAHKDSISDGQIHPLNWIMTLKTDSEDVDYVLNFMHKLYKKLSLLVATENPPILDKIFTSDLIHSFPNNWLHIVTPLMQLSTLDSVIVVCAIKVDLTRCKTNSDMVSVKNLKASRAITTQYRHNYTPSSSKHSVSAQQYTNTPGHDSSNCTFFKWTNPSVYTCWALEEAINNQEEELASKLSKSSRPLNSSIHSSTSAFQSSKARKATVLHFWMVQLWKRFISWLTCPHLCSTFPA